MKSVNVDDIAVIDTNDYRFENGTAFVEPMEQLKKEIEATIFFNQETITGLKNKGYGNEVINFYENKINELQWVLSRIKDLQK
jgi:hypothetical protein